MLETIEIETAAKPNASILWLHGLGADGHDFAPVVPAIVRPGERAWRFIFPHAPVRPVNINGGASMRAWYDITGFDRTSSVDADGLRSTDAEIRQLIAKEIKRDIPASRIVLAGFSQGGAVALYVATRFDQAVAGVMALSAYVPAEESFAADRASANNATAIFMAHGRADPVLPFAMGLQSRDFLRTFGYSVEWHEYPMAHSVCDAEISDIREFLLRALP